MKVLLVAYHSCIRVIKTAMMLDFAGIEFELLTHHVGMKEFVPFLQPVTYFRDREDYAKLLSTMDMSKYSLVHVHNEPDYLGVEMKKAFPSFPLVFDCHDSDSVRWGKMSEDEKYIYSNCDSFVFPSKGYAKYAIDMHDVPPERCAVIYSQVNQSLLLKDPEPFIGGCVVVGGALADAAGKDVRNIEAARRRDYREMGRFLKEHNIPFSVYSSHAISKASYEEAGVDFHPPVLYGSMFQAISKYAWGIVGNGVQCLQRTIGFSNKIWEYLSAGIPVLVIGADEMGRFVEEQGIGLYLDSYEDIPKVYDQHEKIRRTVVDKRGNYTMERQYPVLMSIYKEAIENCK